MIIKFRSIIRRFIDSFYCKNFSNKRNVGSGESWTVIIDNDLSNIILFSGGVGKDISFELEMVNKHKAKAFVFDPSPTGIITINELGNKIPPNLHFQPIGLSGIDGNLEFNFPNNLDEGSFKTVNPKTKDLDKIVFPCKKLSTLMKELGQNRIDILKIDIEGSEYDVLEDILSNNLSVSQICVEFHHFFEEIPKSLTINYLRRLKKSGYVCFHKRGLNYSFIKK
jgi:FkbM family methyltransferase